MLTGCADDYVDDKGSTLLGYCIGPANECSVPMLKLLMEFGASPTHRNDAGFSAMAYAKAWRAHHSSLLTEEFYQEIIRILEERGCDVNEQSAF